MSPPAARNALMSLMPARGKRDSHSGLLLQRYLENWAAGANGDPDQKRKIIAAAIQAIQRQETRQLYKIAYDRWWKSFPEGTITSELQTSGRLIVGLGTENVLEAGITLHHTYGMPILPGSALKGLAAHYCDQVWGERNLPTPSDEARKFRNSRPEDRKNQRPAEPQGQYHKLLFGSTDDSGCVVFHDGWFIPDSEPDPLKLDVMTPHHLNWLDGSVPPTDFDSPNPVPFLSIAGRFHIAVSWCGPLDAEGRWKWFLAHAAECLRDALFHWGIGGKTTSGYGRFDKDKWKADEAKRLAEAKQRRIAAEREATLATMSPIERKIQEFLEQHPNKAEKREWLKLYEELRKSEGRFNTPEERRAVALRVKAGMQADKVWKDKGKEGERKKFIQDILGER